jgi:hypothetical protein
MDLRETGLGGCGLVLSDRPVSRDISGASKRMGEGNENLIYPSPWNLRVLLHAVKSYDMGPSRFTSHPKEGVLRIVIALKNPSPWPGSNPVRLNGCSYLQAGVRHA